MCGGAIRVDEGPTHLFECHGHTGQREADVRDALPQTQLAHRIDDLPEASLPCFLARLASRNPIAQWPEKNPG